MYFHGQIDLRFLLHYFFRQKSNCNFFYSHCINLHSLQYLFLQDKMWNSFLLLYKWSDFWLFAPFGLRVGKTLGNCSRFYCVMATCKSFFFRTLMLRQMKSHRHKKFTLSSGQEWMNDNGFKPCQIAKELIGCTCMWLRWTQSVSYQSNKSTLWQNTRSYTACCW